MPIKLRESVWLIASALCFVLLSPLAQAAPAEVDGSQYRINNHINDQDTAAADYQLQAEYRLQTQQQPHKRIKVTIPASGLQVNWPRNPVIAGKFSELRMDNSKLAMQPFNAEIALAARAASLDPALVHAVIYVESRYQRRALSAKGAIGLMQVLPDTAARYGIKNASNSPKANLRAGTLYLRDLMRMFDNRLDLALAAYNAGEGAVVKYSGQVPPYRETQQYVLAVMAKYNEWRNVETLAKNNDIEAELALPGKPTEAPAEAARVEYLEGTRLADSDEIYTEK